MEEEFATALVKILRAEIPGPWSIDERAAVYRQGGPREGQITYAVSYPISGAGLARIIGVAVDVDVWAAGPDGSEADRISDLVERSLIDLSVNTLNQGNVRLNSFSRSAMTEQVAKLAHVTMRFNGRAFRRLE